jgi:haloalkane dehalogenase
MDHLGFGLSDKPERWTYRPEDHAGNLEVLIERLGLRDITLVVHDFGGPIGLAYATRRPANVRALVLFNTWMWSLQGTAAERVSRLMGGPVGRILYQRFNLSPRVLIKAAFGDKRKLTTEVHRQYIEAFPVPAARKGPWVLARELIGSSSWYEGLWQCRARIVEKPALVLWGMKDPAFGGDALARWKAALTNARIVEFPEAGHFVQEEAPEEAARAIRTFLSPASSSRPRL